MEIKGLGGSNSNHVIILEIVTISIMREWNFSKNQPGSDPLVNDGHTIMMNRLRSFLLLSLFEAFGRRTCVMWAQKLVHFSILGRRLAIWNVRSHTNLSTPTPLLMRQTLVVFLLAGSSISPLMAKIRNETPENAKIDMEGVWAFNGRSECKVGNAWIFMSDGSYSEIMLPDFTAQGDGKWVLRGNTLFYSLALPKGSIAGPLTKRMDIIEHSPKRIVAITGRRVRHVMHRCP